MAGLQKRVVEFWTEEDGPTAVEYAVMLALIILICFVSIQFLGNVTNKTFNDAKLGSALTTGS